MVTNRLFPNISSRWLFVRHVGRYIVHELSSWFKFNSTILSLAMDLNMSSFMADIFMHNLETTFMVLLFFFLICDFFVHCQHALSGRRAPASAPALWWSFLRSFFYWIINLSFPDCYL